MFRVWLLAARPKTLPACVAPVLIGSALAYGDGAFHAASALCALLGALCIQIGTNFVNDYSDFAKGADTAERVGPLRAVNAGLITPRAMAIAAALAFALALVPGAYLIYRGGLPILAVGILSIASGWLYTGGPYPLGYLGLGDLFVLVFFGPVAVGGTYHVQVQSIDWLPPLAGLAPGLLSAAILAVNNLRDADGDVKAGKRTLAVRFGKGFARVEYAACVVTATLVIPPLICWMIQEHWYALAGCGAILPGAWLIARVYRESGPALNDVLAGTGKVLVLFSVLFAGGWMI